MLNSHPNFLLLPDVSLSPALSLTDSNQWLLLYSHILFTKQDEKGY